MALAPWCTLVECSAVGDVLTITCEFGTKEPVILAENNGKNNCLDLRETSKVCSLLVLTMKPLNALPGAFFKYFWTNRQTGRQTETISCVLRLDAGSRWCHLHVH